MRMNESNDRRNGEMQCESGGGRFDPQKNTCDTHTPVQDEVTYSAPLHGVKRKISARNGLEKGGKYEGIRFRPTMCRIVE